MQGTWRSGRGSVAAAEDRPTERRRRCDDTS